MRILRGSEEDARYLRKHGHGEVWKHRYKVLEVRPHAVRLQIPDDGSVPRINPWQLIRRCEPSPTDEVLPSENDPVLTDQGIPLSGSSEQTPTWDPTLIYEIERIIEAQKLGNRYRLLVKWEGWTDPTWEWKSDIEKQDISQALQDEINDAVERYKDKVDAHRVLADDEEEDLAETTAEEEVPLPSPGGVPQGSPDSGSPGVTSEGRFPRRVRRPPDWYDRVAIVGESLPSYSAVQAVLTSLREGAVELYRRYVPPL